MAVSTAAHPYAAEGGHGVIAARARHASRSLLTNLARSIAIFVPVFFVATFATFLLRALSGLNPARIQLGEDATPLEINRIEASYGLDRGFFAQYWSWLTGVLHGKPREQLVQWLPGHHADQGRPDDQPARWRLWP